MDLQKIRSARLKETLRQEFEMTLDERVTRYLEIGHIEIVADTHFSEASSECLKLYRDGYFIASVMMCHAVNEGLIKFIAERNGLRKGEFSVLIQTLLKKKIITPCFGKASRAIWGSYRNAIHHMNPKVRELSFVPLAKDNIQRLSLIENEIFSFTHDNGKTIMDQPKYWDIKEDGTTQGFLRCE
jgi:hypothetical protein